MSTTPLIINGVTYDYPETGAQKWGPDATGWATAVTSGMLQKAGGLFQLLAEVDFGTTYGIKSVYLKSRATNVGSAGFIRLGNTQAINWRNFNNDGDVGLSVNVSDQLVFSGALIPSSNNAYDLGLTGTRFKNLFLAGNGTIAGNLAVSGTFSSGAYTVTDLTATGNTILGDNSADTLTVNASLASSLIPATDATYTLGSSLKVFSDCYFGDINTKKVVPSIDATYELGSSGRKFSNGYFSNTVTMDRLITTTVGSDLTPLTTNTYDLGVTGTRWRNLWLSGALTAASTLSASNFSGSSSGVNTGDQTITLTGQATGSGTGSFAVTLTNASVIGKVLTGYTSGAGTVSATDTILQAVQKLNGNIALVGPSITDLTGEVTATGPGSVAATVTNSAVIGKVLTGYTSGAGTVSATDTILESIQKLNGNAAVISGAAVTSLTGEATGTGPGATAITLANSAVIAKVLTGYTSGAGTVSATDTILQAVQKLNGNDALKLPLVGGTISGDLTVQGNSTFGDATSDTITATARFASSLVPSSSNANDLGTTALRWKDLWLSGALTAASSLSASNFSGSSSGSNTGDQTITLTGNVTGSGTGSFATTIASGVVTNAMLAGSIAYSKLSLTGAIVNADLAGSIAGSKILPTFTSAVVGNAGSATSTLLMGGRLYSIVSNGGNANTTETDLHTYTIAANTLSANYYTITAEGSGFVNANGNTKTLKLYFGSNAITLYSATGNNLTWVYRIKITRSSSGAQRYNGYIMVGTAITVFESNFSTTDSSTIVIKTTGQGTSDNDILERNFDVSFDAA